MWGRGAEKDFERQRGREVKKAGRRKKTMSEEEGIIFREYEEKKMKLKNKMGKGETMV